MTLHSPHFAHSRFDEHGSAYANPPSLTQVFNYLFGSLSRIFTTLQEVDDPLILYGFIAGFILNAVLAAQMLYYWNSPVPARKEALEHIKGKAGVGQAGAGKGREEALGHIKEKAVGREEALGHIKDNALGSSPGGVGTGAARKGPSTRRRG